MGSGTEMEEARQWWLKAGRMVTCRVVVGVGEWQSFLELSGDGGFTLRQCCL